jgi:S1-C subfamily serine protease
MHHTGLLLTTLRRASSGFLLVTALVRGDAAQADSREAAQAALAATVAVEWKHPDGSAATRSAEDTSDLYVAAPSAASVSSGTIVSGDGMIVTFAADAKQGDVTVTLPDGRDLPAKRLVVDRRSQLALVKVEAAELDAISLAERAPAIGETVLAAMCTDTEHRVVSQGIVAATELSVGRLPHKVLQAEVRATRLSAGAPLVNAEGQLVGVIIAATAEGLEAAGPALAIPTEHVRKLLEAKPEDDAEVVLESGFLGLSFGSDLSAPPVVGSVLDGSPASHVDIEKGDKIVAVDEQQVASTSDAVNTIAARQAGDVVEIELVRDEEPLRVRVRLGERPQRDSNSAMVARALEEAIPYRAELYSPGKLYVLGADGKVKGVDLSDSEGGAAEVPQGQVRVFQAYVDAVNGLAQPQVLRVERTELDQKLEKLTGEVESLGKQVESLAEQLRQISEQLKEE